MLITTYKVIFTISVIICFANITEIVLLLKTRKWKHNAQILLLNLALADVTLGVTTSITFGASILREENQSDILALIQRLLLTGNVYGSLFIAVLISTDRFIAVKWPLKYRILMTKRRLYTGILFSWLLAFLIASVVILVKNALIYIGGSTIILIAVILVYLYSSIFFIYRKSVREMIIHISTKDISQKFSKGSIEASSEDSREERTDISTESSNDERHKCDLSSQPRDASVDKIKKISMSDKEIRLLKFCVAIVVCFSLSYMPMGIALAISGVTPEKISPFTLNAIIANALQGSLWNPFLYFFYQFFNKFKLCEASRR